MFLRGWLSSFWHFEGLLVPLITKNLKNFNEKFRILSSDICLQTSLWFNNEHLILIFSDLNVVDDTSYFRIEVKNTRKPEDYWIITTWIISFIFWTKNRQKIDINNFTELVTAPYLIDLRSWNSPNNFWIDCIWKCYVQFFISNCQFGLVGGPEVLITLCKKSNSMN